MDHIRGRAHWYACIMLAVTNVLIWHAVFAESNTVLTVAFLDVGQGDAIFIEAPSGAQVLVDGGSNTAVLEQLGKVMSFYDRSIDVVIATHPDKDHVGGLPAVLLRYDVSYVLEPGAQNDTGVYRALEDVIADSGVSRILARRGMIVDLGDGVELRILFPDRDVSRVSNTNDASIVAQLVYGETEVMLTGDAPQKIERHLAALDGHALQSDILKAGHHGSKTSSSELFVGFVDPDIAVISAGAHNRYGHPHQEVTDLFDRLDIETVSTVLSGTVIFTSDGVSWRTPDPNHFD